MQPRAGNCCSMEGCQPRESCKSPPRHLNLYSLAGNRCHNRANTCIVQTSSLKMKLLQALIICFSYNVHDHGNPCMVQSLVWFRPIHSLMAKPSNIGAYESHSCSSYHKGRLWMSENQYGRRIGICREDQFLDRGVWIRSHQVRPQILLTTMFVFV